MGRCLGRRRAAFSTPAAATAVEGARRPGGSCRRGGVSIQDLGDISMSSVRMDGTTA